MSNYSVFLWKILGWNTGKEKALINTFAFCTFKFNGKFALLSSFGWNNFLIMYVLHLSFHVMQHIEDLTQEKFSLQRALEASRALAESLASENSSLTETYNQQVWLHNMIFRGIIFVYLFSLSVH